jgi:recombination protein RecA
MFDEGISRLGELVDLGTEKGMIEKSGAWYSYRGERIGQGRENVKQFLRENPVIAKQINEEVLSSYGLAKLSTDKPTEKTTDKTVVGKK